MSRDLKQSMKKIRRGSRGKHQGVASCRREQKVMMLNSITDGTDAVQNNLLMELGTQLAIKLKISTNFKPKLERVKSNWTAACETQEEVASNSSGYKIDAAQANEVPLHANMSWFSSDNRSANSNWTHDITQDKSESTKGEENEKEEKASNGEVRTLATASHSKVDMFDTRRSMDKGVTVCRNDAGTVSGKKRSTVSNCKSQSKHKIKLDKITTANRSASSRIQEEHLVNQLANQVGIVCKLYYNFVLITGECIHL